MDGVVTATQVVAPQGGAQGLEPDAQDVPGLGLEDRHNMGLQTHTDSLTMTRTFYIQAQIQTTYIHIKL